ncbi:MAG: hypothetical protein Q7S95_04205 [bacterium]|nr:hypothetical protein [bacterium]
MMSILSRLFGPETPEQPFEYAEMREKTGFIIAYTPREDGTIVIAAVSKSAEPLEISFSAAGRDEAHILYMEVTELLRSRAKLGQDTRAVRTAVAALFGVFRGERPPPEAAAPSAPNHTTSGEFVPNPGKSLAIDVDGTTYLRLPIKTRLITTRDTDILPLIEQYVQPHLAAGDTVYVSEKALTITQGRVVDMNRVKPTWLARFLARNVGNYYGSEEFHGFGHGTDLAMQLFIEEAGYPRIIFAAAVSALTRPLGIRGLFYWICGKRAKSIDCPMSFLILEYAHSVKLAPNDPSGAAKRIRGVLGREVVILDANYRGAFSLGKSTHAISEAFIGKLFRDNPLGQSDEMTPFCIVRKAAV